MRLFCNEDSLLVIFHRLSVLTNQCTRFEAALVVVALYRQLTPSNTGYSTLQHSLAWMEMRRLDTSEAHTLEEKENGRSRVAGSRLFRGLERYQ
ncbi:UNVERIFIED_CONTAM: hypothetical protein FKN15_012305 [Acipenser sinensis]